MILCYSRKSAVGATMIESESRDIQALRRPYGDVNWGRAHAYTRLNSDTSKATNKHVMRQLFQAHGVPMPTLYGYFHAYALACAGTPLIGRPDHHMKGRGFWRIASEADFRRAVQGTRRKAAATHFMAYVDAPTEYRVHIFLGKSIRISEKAHTAFHEYTTVRPDRGKLQPVRRAAKQAVQALGLDFGAVDILADDQGQVWVLEVNSAPGIGGSVPKLYAQAFERWDAQDGEAA